MLMVFVFEYGNSEKNHAPFISSKLYITFKPSDIVYNLKCINKIMFTQTHYCVKNVQNILIVEFVQIERENQYDDKIVALYVCFFWSSVNIIRLLF